MLSSKTIDIAALLTQAGNAHHIYEQTELKGVFDQDWANWYADYVIQHGIANLLSQPVTTKQMGQFFNESYEVYKQEKATQNWAEYTAEKLAKANF